MSISPSDRDLAELAAASQLDGVLSALASIASSGGQHLLGLLINGMTVYGRTESPRALFEAIDAENARMIELGRASNAPGWDAEPVGAVEGMWTRDFEEDQRQHRELMDRTEGQELDEMSDEDLRETIADRETTLTLADVHVFPPAGPEFEVPLMRVRIAQVAAWWILPTNAEGMASFSHPTMGVD